MDLSFRCSALEFLLREFGNGLKRADFHTEGKGVSFGKDWRYVRRKIEPGRRSPNGSLKIAVNCLKSVIFIALSPEEVACERSREEKEALAHVGRDVL